mmetsp:Transcript_14813/g.40544  ORF Transcript_14813/g.40544 Transcript_14813/m.40544 type:complete len:265 (+) Transcript_14813:902-1696(+)
MPTNTKRLYSAGCSSMTLHLAAKGRQSLQHWHPLQSLSLLSKQAMHLPHPASHLTASGPMQLAFPAHKANVLMHPGETQALQALEQPWLSTSSSLSPLTQPTQRMQLDWHWRKLGVPHAGEFAGGISFGQRTPFQLPSSRSLGGAAVSSVAASSLPRSETPARRKSSAQLPTSPPSVQLGSDKRRPPAESPIGMPLTADLPKPPYGPGTAGMPSAERTLYWSTDLFRLLIQSSKLLCSKLRFVGRSSLRTRTTSGCMECTFTSR